MRTMLAFVLAAVALPTAAGAQPTQVATGTEPRAAAMVLARLLNSEANIVGSSTEDDVKALALAQQLIASQPDLIALEKRHPGIGVALAEALLPISNRSMRERLPELQRRQALLYGATFTDAELATLTAFYGSATGKKLVSAMFAVIKPNAMLAEARTSSDFKISPDAVLSDIRSSRKDILAQMDANDQLELLKLGTSGLAPRMKDLAPKTQALVLAWMNESAPWEDVETEAVTRRIMKRFHAERD